MKASPELLTQILEICLEFGNEMLTKRGEFYPFGAQVTSDGSVGMVGGHIGEHPDKRELYQFLLNGFKKAAESGSVSAIALAADVDIPADYESDFRDGIRVLLEASDYSRFVYTPYSVNRPSGLRRIFNRSYEVTTGEMFSVEIPHCVFPATEQIPD